MYYVIHLFYLDALALKIEFHRSPGVPKEFINFRKASCVFI